MPKCSSISWFTGSLYWCVADCRKLVTEVMDEESILFIFGDHGMTPTGDHGGETSLETDAALIVYSKKPLFDPSEVSNKFTTLSF